MRFASLGSGSRGNATLVQSGQTTIMIDCGFSAIETARRLQRFELDANDVDAIIVTHEHADHVAGVLRFARRHGTNVYMTAGTFAGLNAADPQLVTLISPHQAFTVGDLEVHPYPVPHDAREPCQYVIRDGSFCVGLLSDVGEITPHIIKQLGGCDALFIEANHDPAMLDAGPYPLALKDRVGGRLGHLSNHQSAVLLGAVKHSGLQHVVCGHLSEQNNSPELARAALAEALACDPEWIGMANQEQGFAWRQIV